MFACVCVCMCMCVLSSTEEEEEEEERCTLCTSRYGYLCTVHCLTIFRPLFLAPRSSLPFFSDGRWFGSSSHLHLHSRHRSSRKLRKASPIRSGSSRAPWKTNRSRPRNQRKSSPFYRKTR
uniref:Putative secreted protein n=1 Tax=Anopheles darlingi TaxID=43151 RepID=A0A2M4D6X9_ANODA